MDILLPIMFVNRSLWKLHHYLIPQRNSFLHCVLLVFFIFIISICLSYLFLSQNGRPDELDVPAATFYLHYIRFSSKLKRNFTFTDYLSVLSGVQYLQPDEILFHGDAIPSGPYWDNLTARHVIRHVHMERPTNFGSLNGVAKKASYVEHAADVAKLEVLLKYGGVAIDFDVFFIHGHRIKQVLKKKKAITCYNDADTYNIGLVAGHQDSKFLRAWRRSYIDIYVEYNWNFNQAYVSKFLSVIMPEEVYVANYICLMYIPEPIDVADEDDLHYYRNAMALHSFERFSEEKIESIEDLQKANLTARTELFRNIYYNVQLPPADPDFDDEVIPDKL